MNNPLLAISWCSCGDVSPFNVIAAAALGASFYILIRSYKYLVERSFDPDYSNSYVCRFVLGIISGLILANVAPIFVHKGDTLAGIGPGLFAMLGGFAVEAVELVLNRIVEIMVSMVRGDASSAVQAKADATVEKTRNDLAKKLSTAMGTVTDPTAKAVMKQMLDTLG